MNDKSRVGLRNIYNERGSATQVAHWLNRSDSSDSWTSGLETGQYTPNIHPTQGQQDSKLAKFDESKQSFKQN
jgi:hypothetical protein